MAFDTHRKADIVVVTEGPTDAASTPNPSAPRAAKFVVKDRHVTSPYDEAAALAKRDITWISMEGRKLRAEAEAFVSWIGTMGERTCAPSWGANQENYAAVTRIQMRAEAAKWKSDVANRLAEIAVIDGRDLTDAELAQRTERFVDGVFGDHNRIRTDCTEAATKQAREELGL